MQTYINWELNESETDEVKPSEWEEEYGEITGDSFECCKLIQGDKVILNIDLDDGGSVTYPVVVSSVDIDIYLKPPRRVVQWVRLKEWSG